MNHLQIDLVAHQLPDVCDAILDHCGPRYKEKELNYMYNFNLYKFS